MPKLLTDFYSKSGADTTTTPTETKIQTLQSRTQEKMKALNGTTSTLHEHGFDPTKSLQANLSDAIDNQLYKENGNWFQRETILDDKGNIVEQRKVPYTLLNKYGQPAVEDLYIDMTKEGNYKLGLARTDQGGFTGRYDTSLHPDWKRADNGEIYGRRGVTPEDGPLMNITLPYNYAHEFEYGVHTSPGQIKNRVAKDLDREWGDFGLGIGEYTTPNAPMWNQDYVNDSAPIDTTDKYYPKKPTLLETYEAGGKQSGLLSAEDVAKYYSSTNELLQVPGAVVQGVTEAVLGSADFLSELVALGSNKLFGTDISSDGIFKDGEAHKLASKYVGEALWYNAKSDEVDNQKAMDKFGKAFKKFEFSNPSSILDTDLGALWDSLKIVAKNPTLAASSIGNVYGSVVGGGALKLPAKVAFKTFAKDATKIAVSKSAEARKAIKSAEARKAIKSAEVRKAIKLIKENKNLNKAEKLKAMEKAREDLSKMEKAREDLSKLEAAAYHTSKIAQPLAYGMFVAEQDMEAMRQDGIEPTLARHLGALVTDTLAVALPEIAVTKYALGGAKAAATGANKTVKKKVLDTITHIGKSGMLELPEETFQAMVQEVNQKWGTDEYKDKTIAELINDASVDILGQGIMGAVSGAHMGVVGGIKQNVAGGVTGLAESVADKYNNMKDTVAGLKSTVEDEVTDDPRSKVYGDTSKGVEDHLREFLHSVEIGADGNIVDPEHRKYFDTGLAYMKELKKNEAKAYVSKGDIEGMAKVLKSDPPDPIIEAIAGLSEEDLQVLEQKINASNDEPLKGLFRQAKALNSAFMKVAKDSDNKFKFKKDVSDSVLLSGLDQKRKSAYGFLVSALSAHTDGDTARYDANIKNLKDLKSIGESKVAELKKGVQEKVIPTVQAIVDGIKKRTSSEVNGEVIEEPEENIIKGLLASLGMVQSGTKEAKEYWGHQQNLGILTKNTKDSLGTIPINYAAEDPRFVLHTEGHEDRKEGTFEVNPTDALLLYAKSKGVDTSALYDDMSTVDKVIHNIQVDNTNIAKAQDLLDKYVSGKPIEPAEPGAEEAEKDTTKKQADTPIAAPLGTRIDKPSDKTYVESKEGDQPSTFVDVQEGELALGTVQDTHTYPDPGVVTQPKGEAKPTSKPEEQKPKDPKSTPKTDSVPVELTDKAKEYYDRLKGTKDGNKHVIKQLLEQDLDKASDAWLNSFDTKSIKATSLTVPTGKLNKDGTEETEDVPDDIKEELTKKIEAKKIKIKEAISKRIDDRSDAVADKKNKEIITKGEARLDKLHKILKVQHKRIVIRRRKIDKLNNEIDRVQTLKNHIDKIEKEYQEERDKVNSSIDTRLKEYKKLLSHLNATIDDKTKEADKLRDSLSFDDDKGVDIFGENATMLKTVIKKLQVFIEEVDKTIQNVLLDLYDVLDTIVGAERKSKLLNRRIKRLAKYRGKILKKLKEDKEAKKEEAYKKFIHENYPRTATGQVARATKERIEKTDKLYKQSSSILKSKRKEKSKLYDSLVNTDGVKERIEVVKEVVREARYKTRNTKYAEAILLKASKGKVERKRSREFENVQEENKVTVTTLQLIKDKLNAINDEYEASNNVATLKKRIDNLKTTLRNHIQESKRLTEQERSKLTGVVTNLSYDIQQSINNVSKEWGKLARAKEMTELQLTKALAPGRSYSALSARPVTEEEVESVYGKSMSDNELKKMYSLTDIGNITDEDIALAPYVSLLLDRNNKVEKNVVVAAKVAMNAYMLDNIGALKITTEKNAESYYGVREDEVTTEMLKAGIPIEHIGIQVGKNIMKLLGLGPNKDLKQNADEHFEKIAAGIGKAAVYAAVHDGLLRTVETDMDNGKKALSLKWKNPNRLDITKDKLITMVTNADAAFDVERTRETFHLKPRVRKVEGVGIRRQPLEKPSVIEAESIIKAEQTLWTMNNEAANIMDDFMNTEVKDGGKNSNFHNFLKLQGFVEAADMKGWTHEEQIAQEAKNEQISRNMENMTELLKSDEARRYGMYFRWFIASNHRPMIDAQGGIDPQGIKLFRYLLNTNEQIGTVIPGEFSETMFKLGVAQAFGFAIDKEHVKDSTKFADDLLDATIIDKIHDRLLEGNAKLSIVSVKEGGKEYIDVIPTEFDNDDKAIYLDTEKRKETPIHAFKVDEAGHAIVAIAEINKYIKAKGSKFETRMTVEIDGLTNGFAHKLMQYLAVNDELANTVDEKTLKWLDKVGKTTGEKDIVSAIKEGKLVDVYRSLGYTVAGVDEVGDVINDQIDSNVESLLDNSDDAKAAKDIQKFFGVEVPENGANEQLKDTVRGRVKALRDILPPLAEMVDDKAVLTGFVRDLMKYPFMMFGYSAGYNTIAKNLANALLDDAKIARKIMNNEKLHKDDEKGVGEVLVEAFGGDFNTVQKELGEKTYDKIMLGGTNLKDAVSGLIAGTYGEAVKAALSEEFSAISNINEAMVNGTAVMYAIFRADFNKRLKDAGYSDGVAPNDVTMDILYEMRDEHKLPMVKTPMGGEMLMLKDKKVRSKDSNIGRSHTFVTKDGKAGKVANKVERVEVADPGINISVLLTQASDAANMYSLMIEHEINHVFDAIVAGVGQDGLIKEANEAMIKNELLGGWSHIGAVNEAMEEMIRKSGLESDEKLQAEVDKIMLKAKEDAGIYVPESDEPMWSSARDTLNGITKAAENRRNDLLSKEWSWEQFVLDKEHTYRNKGTEALERIIPEGESVDTATLVQINDIITDLNTEMREDCGKA